MAQTADTLAPQRLPQEIQERNGATLRSRGAQKNPPFTSAQVRTSTKSPGAPTAHTVRGVPGLGCLVHISVLGVVRWWWWGQTHTQLVNAPSTLASPSTSVFVHRACARLKMLRHVCVRARVCTHVQLPEPIETSDASPANQSPRQQQRQARRGVLSELLRDMSAADGHIRDNRVPVSNFVVIAS